jgi:hypothetical protein
MKVEPIHAAKAWHWAIKNALARSCDDSEAFEQPTICIRQAGSRGGAIWRGTDAVMQFDALFLLGLIHLQTGRPDEAERVFSRALTTDPRRRMPCPRAPRRSRWAAMQGALLPGSLLAAKPANDPWYVAATACSRWSVSRGGCELRSRP